MQIEFSDGAQTVFLAGGTLSPRGPANVSASDSGRVQVSERIGGRQPAIFFRGNRSQTVSFEVAQLNANPTASEENVLLFPYDHAGQGDLIFTLDDGITKLGMPRAVVTASPRYVGATSFLNVQATGGLIAPVDETVQSGGDPQRVTVTNIFGSQVGDYRRFAATDAPLQIIPDPQLVSFGPAGQFNEAFLGLMPGETFWLEVVAIEGGTKEILRPVPGFDWPVWKPEDVYEETWDARDLVGVLADLDPVASHPGAIGAVPLAQSTGSARPTFLESDSDTGGDPSVSYDGGDTLVASSVTDFDADQNVTFFLVFKRNVTGTTDVPLLKQDTTTSPGYRFHIASNDSTSISTMRGDAGGNVGLGSSTVNADLHGIAVSWGIEVSGAIGRVASDIAVNASIVDDGGSASNAELLTVGFNLAGKIPYIGIDSRQTHSQSVLEMSMLWAQHRYPSIVFAP